MDDLWTVDVPNGGSSTPYRFGDFAGHDYSKSMIDSCSISFNECYVNDANIINVFYNKSNTKILTYKDIKYGVTSSGSGGTALSDMYAGYVVVKGTNYGVYCEGKLSSTITEGTSYQSLINIDYNAFGNTSGVFTIYPVLFLNNVTTQYWHSSISANIIPLPVEPITLTLTFKDYAAQITSITYNTNTLTVKAKNISSLSINTGGTPINIKLIRYIGGSYDNQNTTTNSITTGVFSPNTTFTGTVTGTFNTADRYQLILTISTTSGEKTIASSGFIKIVNGVFVNENGTSITYPI